MRGYFMYIFFYFFLKLFVFYAGLQILPHAVAAKT